MMNTFLVDAPDIKCLTIKGIITEIANLHVTACHCCVVSNLLTALSIPALPYQPLNNNDHKYEKRT